MKPWTKTVTATLLAGAMSLWAGVLPSAAEDGWDVTLGKTKDKAQADRWGLF